MFLSHAQRSTPPSHHARATKTSLNAPPLQFELVILNPRRRRLASLPAPASCVLAPRAAPGLLTRSVHTSTTSSLACPPPAHKHTSPPATQRPSSASSRLVGASHPRRFSGTASRMSYLHPLSSHGTRRDRTPPLPLVHLHDGAFAVAIFAYLALGHASRQTALVILHHSHDVIHEPTLINLHTARRPPRSATFSMFS
jgi:hypothetical protein